MIGPTQAKLQRLLVASTYDSMFVLQNHLMTLLTGYSFVCGILNKSGKCQSISSRRCAGNQIHRNGQSLKAHAVCEIGSHGEFTASLSTR